MKKYITLSLVPVSLFLASCGGDKNDSVSSETTSQNTATQQVQKQGSHQAVKDALKSQVNGVTADLMLKTPSFADLPPASYDIPSSLEGREMVQVSVRWPFIAKYDLYQMDSVLSELPDQPTVIEKVHSKGDELDYVEVVYVLQSDGGGGYIAQNSRNVKGNFSFDDLSAREKLGKITLIKGSDEHLAAAQKVSEIKQEAEEKQRLEKLEAEKKKMAEAKAKKDQLLKVLQKGGDFRGPCKNVSQDQTAEAVITNIKVTEKAGRTFVELNLSEIDSYKNKPRKPATFSGSFDENGELVLNVIKPGDTKTMYGAAGFIRGMGNPLIFEDSGHIDSLKLKGKSSNRVHALDLIRQ